MVLVEELLDYENDSILESKAQKANNEESSVDASSKAHESIRCAYCNDTKPRNRCPLCRDIWYCSQGCQKADWKTHKKSCARKFDRPKPNKVQNPCVKCGKPGLKQSGPDWFCSDTCLHYNLSDWTNRVKKAINSESNCAPAPSDEQRPSPPPDATRVTNFLKHQLNTASAPAAASTKDRVTDLLENQLNAQSTPAAASIKDDKRLFDFISGQCNSSASPEIPNATRNIEESKRIAELINKADGSACKNLPDPENTKKVSEFLKQKSQQDSTLDNHRGYIQNMTNIMNMVKEAEEGQREKDKSFKLDEME